MQLFSNLADGVNVGENETSGHEVMKFTILALFRIPKFTDCPRKENRHLEIMPVTLSAAKGLARRA